MFERGVPYAELESVEGVKQGDSLGSFLFCLAIQDALRQCCQGLPLCRAIGYIDDIKIIGHADQALQAYGTLKRALARIGLQLVPSKCAVLYNGDSEAMPDPVRQKVTEAGLPVVEELVVLGCLITTNQVKLRAWLDDKMIQMREDCKLIQHNTMRTQSAMLLLRMSLNAHMDYLMRVMPPADLRNTLGEFDTLMQQTFFALAGINDGDLSNDEYELAIHRLRLPISMGGLGLAAKSDLAPIAWYASLLTAVPDVLAFSAGDGTRAEHSWLGSALFSAEARLTANDPMYRLDLPAGMPSALDAQPVPQAHGPPPPRVSLWQVAADKFRVLRRMGTPRTDADCFRAPPRIQHSLTENFHKRRHRALKRTLRDAAKRAELASLLSASQRNAALWLTALPTEPWFRLRDEEIRGALRLRLHLAPCELNALRTTICPCGHGDLADDPLHFQTCALLKRTAGTVRHNFVLQGLSFLAGELGIPHTVEPRAGEVAGHNGTVTPQPATRQKPDLLLVTACHSVSELLTDVTITHPAAASAITNGADTRPLQAAKTAETRKQTKYGHLVNAANGRGHKTCELKAFAMESLGAFGPQAEYILKCMFKHAMRNTVGDALQPQDARILLSIALQRGNALMGRKGIDLICATSDEYPQPSPHRRRSHIGTPSRRVFIGSHWRGVRGPVRC
jgi:hypothetical protein